MGREAGASGRICYSIRSPSLETGFALKASADRMRSTHVIKENPLSRLEVLLMPNIPPRQHLVFNRTMDAAA